ncbi:MAG: ABC transporter ATP-binding protein [Pseudomonadota bacterium]
MLRQFFAYYRPHKRLFWLDFGCASLSGVLELAFPLAIAAFIDHLLPRGDLTLTALAAVALVLVYFINTGLTSIVIYWGHKLGILIETEMRRRAFAHLMKLSWSWYDNAETGKMVARVTRDLEDIGEVAHHGPEDLFVALMTFAGAFVLMLMLHPQLALLTAVIVPMMIWLVAVYGARMTRAWKAIFNRIGRFNVRLEEALGGIRVVQAYTNETHEAALFEGDNRRYLASKLDAYAIMAKLNALQYMGMRLVQVVVMVVGAGFVIDGSLSTGSFVGFLLLVGVFFRPLEKIAAVVEIYPRGIAGFRRYLDLLATDADIKEAPNAIAAPPFQGKITFDDVHFRYLTDRPVLHDISLTINPGERVALVGPSGAGKSTLMAMIARFYEPQQGEISIDGMPLAAMTLSSLRDQIGFVSQEVLLFSGTLRDNIRYGRLDASEAEILAAAAKAQLGALIDDLPEGLDTVVGERGVLLSGGQRQRIAIARAFLKDPPILLLDEATSALDRETEREIQAVLTGLTEGRTTLVIAHRISTIRDADRILVLEAGRIVDLGPHEALLQRSATYRRLAG